MQDRLDGLIPSQGYLAEFLRESRTKVWHNTVALQAARLDVPTAYAERLAELEVLSAARITDLLAPGQVLIRLAVAGFGVTLPPRPERGAAQWTAILVWVVPDRP